ncbi:MAG: PLP-dependent transferase [Cryomorphaceae bacterium]|nr:PLP-dependent transferase [Cryomorphaceae bacterium]
MTDNLRPFIVEVLKNMPEDWLKLTTHRLDIYNEALAKTEFTEQFDVLYNTQNTQSSALQNLPTAFDYIRLGHPLSCVLEWTMAKSYNLKPAHVISFSSRTMPVLAVLRKNLFEKKNTQIFHTDALPGYFDMEALKNIYGYSFDLKKVDKPEDITKSNDRTIFISQKDDLDQIELTPNIDFYVHIHPKLGSVILVNGAQNEKYVSEIQHVRRRESIAMTPANCFSALSLIIDNKVKFGENPGPVNRTQVTDAIQTITGTKSKALLGSSGLSIQYAIMMGLIDHALENHPGKEIKFIVPPNCYGGTNDQARRVAACLDAVEVLDLHVDGENDMVESIDRVLEKVAANDGVPYIIAEIPTNPRVEVPDLQKLRDVLHKSRKTPGGETAIDPVFILDQTFCPNVQFLGENKILSDIRSISYVSGSKFPSGGKCTAGYCVANHKAENVMAKIEKHLNLCDNGATDLQIAILAEQLPSMNQRIVDAYKNTRAFVNFIRDVLPDAKINFVSEELAKTGFTPSVFSLDLPTKGNTAEEREDYKRALNLKLIQLMIREIPNESKYCVSYGQLKGSYWTIPATSTQGTTKETDKDYIARISISPKIDLERHKDVFLSFVKGI